MGRTLRGLQQARLLVYELEVLPAGDGRKQDPAAVRGRIHGVLPRGFAGLYRRARMRQAGHHAEKDRKAHLLGEGEGLAYHVVGLLLVGRFEDRDHGEIGVKTRILLVLGGMHRRVVGGEHDKAALHAGHGGVDEGVGADVHADMFHAHEGALAGIGHAQRGLHGSLFIGAPAAPHLRGIGLDELGHFRGRRAGVCIHAGQSGMERSQGHSLVSEQQSFL